MVLLILVFWICELTEGYNYVCYIFRLLKRLLIGKSFKIKLFILGYIGGVTIK